MDATIPALGPDEWLTTCRTIVTGVKEMLEGAPTIVQRAEETGTRGEGGDRTLVIDAEAESLVFAELKRLADAGHRFTAVSEERGVVDYGSQATVVVIDPIDGSLNAKRGLPHHALSIAVADGPTTADVWFGYVYDFGPREEWWAARGAGARLDGVLLDRQVGERRGRDGRLEVLGIESADPKWVAMRAAALERSAYRLRALGTIASSLCQVAAGRFDGLVSLRNCRSVDAAAAQLIVKEGGGLVAFPDVDGPGAPLLDLAAHSPVVAARSTQTLEQLRSVVA